MSTSIKISCGILFHAIYQNERAMRLLLHIMLSIAEEEAALGTREDREAGVIVRPVGRLAASLGWSRSKTMRALAALRAADAIKTDNVRGGTRIRCLYYSPAYASGPATETPAKKPARTKKAPKEQESIEVRAERFRKECKTICDADAARLPAPLREGFYAYWTEPNKAGDMRFELQPFFDVARRMDTWRRNDEARPKGFKPNEPAPHVKPTTTWNPRG